FIHPAGLVPFNSWHPVVVSNFAHPISTVLLDQIPGFRVPSSSTETTVRSLGFERACWRLWSHAAFLRITRPPFTSGRFVRSFGSNTLTSAGRAAKKPQKSGTPLNLNAASRTVFAVSGRRGFAIRESRFSAAESEGDDSG